MQDAFPEPPDTYKNFVNRFPKLDKAWNLTREEGADGPLDKIQSRLVKLAVAVGAMRQGAVHSNVRKARAMGIDTETIFQVVALASGTLGFPSTVAIYSWVDDVLEEDDD